MNVKFPIILYNIFCINIFNNKCPINIYIKTFIRHYSSVVASLKVYRYKPNCFCAVKIFLQKRFNIPDLVTSMFTLYEYTCHIDLFAEHLVPWSPTSKTRKLDNNAIYIHECTITGLMLRLWNSSRNVTLNTTTTNQ